MNKFHRIDWIKAERFYRAGVLSLAAIGAKCGCSKQAISKKAKEKGWTRDLGPRIRKLAQRKLLEETAAAKASEPEKQSAAPPSVSVPVDAADAQARAREDEALVEAAAREHVMVTQAHRVEAARLMGIARDLGGKLVDLVEGRATGFVVDAKDGSRVRVSFLGEHESLSDALVKVSRALKDLVTLERKAFGIDEQEKNPEKRRDMVPLEERLAFYRREEAMADADNVVEFSPPD